MSKIVNHVRGKMDKPTNEGTQDQILRNDGHGGSVWGNAASQEEIGAAVDQWMDENIPAGQAVAIDKTLTVENAAAGAKAAGDMVLVSQDEPSAASNKLWIHDQAESEYTVPTIDDFNEFSEDMSELVEASDDEPTSEFNKVWIDTDSGNEVTVPTIDEMNKVAGTVAPDYSELTFPVAKGTLCRHEYDLYEAKVDIPSVEAWNSGHWSTKTNIADKLDSLSSAVDELIYERTLTVTRQGQSLETHDFITPGIKYKIKNNTNGTINCALYDQNWQVKTLSIGQIESGAEKTYITNNANSYWLLIYASTASSGTVTVSDLSKEVPSLESSVAEMNTSIEDLNSSISDVQSSLFSLEKSNTYTVTQQAQQFWITDYIQLNKKMRITNNTNGNLNCALYKQDESTATKQIGRFAPGNYVEYTNTNQETYYLLVYASTASSGSFIVEDRSKKIAEIEDDLDALEDEVDNTVYVYLPDDIYCANGRSIEIYNDLVCLNSQKYHIRWICNIGHAITGKFTVTGTSSNIGDYDLTLEVYDNNKKCLYSKTASLHVVEATVPATTLVTLGDSNSCGKFWQAEICGLSNNSITLVGARRFHLTYEGSRKDLNVDGRGGFDTDWYLTGHAASVDYSDSGAETPHHALYDPVAQKFSWSYYVENSLSGVSPDNVMIMLGTNEFGRNIDTFLSNYKQIVDTIRTDDPDITIFIAPCIFSGTQDGIGYQGNIEGYSQLRGAWQYNQDMAVWKQCKGLHETFASYENLYFIETAITMDRWHDYSTEEVFVNPRSSEKVSIQKESIHPTVVGYGQMADTVFSTLCGVLSN